MPAQLVTAVPHDAPDGATFILIICPQHSGKKCEHGKELQHARFEVPVEADMELFRVEAIRETERMMRMGRLRHA